MIEIVAADGYEAVTVRGLAKRARISTGTFYKHYSSTEDCLLCTFDAICGRASRRLMEAGRNEPEQQRRLGLAIDRLFRDMAAATQVSAFMLRAAPTVGPAFTSDLWNSAMRLGAALEFCIRGHDSSPSLHPLLLEGIVAGLARIGGSLGPAAGEEEIRKAVAEAVEWVTSLCGPLVPDADLLGSLPVPGHLRASDWEGVFGDERAMILAAAFRIAKSGYHELSVARICREAGVSRRDFNQHFENLEECFVSAVEEHATRAVKGSVRGRDASGPWRDTVYEALRTLCDAIDADRDSARVLFVDITAAGTQGIDCRDRLISQVVRALRATAPEGRTPSELATGASTVAAWAILRRLVQGRGSIATEALPILLHLTLAPARVENHTAGDKKHTVGVEKPFPLLLDLP